MNKKPGAGSKLKKKKRKVVGKLTESKKLQMKKKKESRSDSLNQTVAQLIRARRNLLFTNLNIENAATVSDLKVGSFFDIARPGKNKATEE